MQSSDVIRRALLRGLTNAETLALVRKKFPHSTMTVPTINLYRNQLRKDHPQITSDREARKRRASGS